MISDLLQSVADQQADREWPLQMLWSHGTNEDGPIVPDGDTPVDWESTIPSHRSEGFTGLPASLPFAISVSEYHSQSGRGYVCKILARVNGEIVELTEQDGPLYWTQRSPRVEMRHKEFTGQWIGHGWRAEVIGHEGPDMGVRSLGFYSDPELTQFLYTIGAAFTEQPSEFHPGLTVWASETPEGQRTPSREIIHWAALFASIQEVGGSLGLDDGVSVGRYWIGLEGEQQLPGPEDPEYPVWVQPTGAHDAYNAGAIVWHNGVLWINTHGNGNVWEPGVFGWALYETGD